MRFAVIGSNFITDRMIEAGKQCPGFELYAVYSRTRERAEEYSAKWKIPVLYTDLYELFNDEQIEAVYIASPTMCHCSQAVALMKAGKHVLCEKPIASNAAECERMIKTAQENKVILLEAMRPEYVPGMQAIVCGLAKIGRARRASLRFCQYSSRYDKFRNGIIENAFKPELSNGAVMDIGVYPIHMMLSLFGRPQRILTDTVKLANGVDGAGSLIFNYGDFQAEIAYSKITNSLTVSEIQGEDGNLLIDKVTNPERVELCYRDGSREMLFEEVVADDMRFEIGRFMDCVHTKTFPTLDLQKTKLTMEVIDRIRKDAEIVFPADQQ